MVEFVDEGKCARPRQPPEARLQPEDAAEGGRHPDRSVRVGSKREVAEPRRDRGGRAARGSTGAAFGVERIARRSIMGVLGRSEEHPSELQYLLGNSYAVFCFTQKKTQ